MIVKKIFKDLRIIKKEDLRPINKEEFGRSMHIASIINDIFSKRGDYIKANNLDPEIHLPQGHWARSEDHVVTRNFLEFLEPSYELLNSFRIKTRFFTIGGWNLECYIDQAKYDSLKPWLDRYIALVRHIPDEIVAKPPMVLGEIGWDINGYPVNPDLCCYQERLNLLYESGLIDFLRKIEKERGVVNILEIGGGYGALAKYITNLVPNVRYVICDIPESILFAAIYLVIACPDFAHNFFADNVLDKKYYDLKIQQHSGKIKNFVEKIAGFVREKEKHGVFVYVPNYLIDAFFEQDGLIFDLCINTLSFSEMNKKQVSYYAGIIKKKIGLTGLLFEQNQDNRHLGSIYAKEILEGHFLYRKEIQYKTMPDLMMGRADLWGNRDISAILK